MPKSFIPLQEAVRSAIQKHIVRGKGDVYVSYKKQTLDSGVIDYDINLASSYVSVAKALKKQFPNLKNDFTP